MVDGEAMQDRSRLPPRSIRRCLRPARPGAGWHQIDIALQRGGSGARANARAMFAELLPILDLDSARSDTRGWFFMRKPPDVRLRIESSPSDGGCLAAVSARLDALVGRGALVAHAEGHYHPEIERFGGDEAMDAVHGWFCLDSRLWARLDQVALALDSGSMLLALVDDLFRACCPEPREAWRALEALLDEHPWSITSHPAAAGPVRVPDWPVPALVARRPYRFANRWLGAALRELDARGRLGRSPVAIAAEVALFGFNRHGFPGTWSAPLVAALRRGTDA